MEKRLEKFVRKAQVIAILLNGLVFFGSLPLIGYHLIKEGNKSNLYSEVRKKADINKDNCITNGEWRKVYDFLGKDYNPNYSNAQKDLSFDEQKRYFNYQ